MHFYFVDESGNIPNPGSTGSRFFVVGGVVMPEESWHGVRQHLINLKRQEGYSGEIKSQFFAPQSKGKNNPMREWDDARRNKFRDAVFGIITGTESLKIICAVCDAPAAYNLPIVYKQEDIYSYTYKFITERFLYFLQDLDKECEHHINGMIVIDQRNSRQDKQLRDLHEILVRDDNAPNTSKYEHFIESIFISPSHTSIGIQLADMVAGAVWRYYEHGDARHITTIKQSFRKSPSGKIDGWGIARFPWKGWKSSIIS